MLDVIHMLMAVMPRIILSLLFPLELVPEQLIAPDMEHPELPVEPEQTCTQEDHLDQAVQCPLEEQLLKMALMDLHHNVPDLQEVTQPVEHLLQPPLEDLWVEMAILEGTEQCINISGGYEAM